jgi:hypothetical protein
MKTRTQPWLTNPLQELMLIMAPALLPVAVVFLFKDYFTSHEVSDVWWVILVLGIDVSHVYSTLFRLYWDRPTFNRYKTWLIAVPIVAFITGFMLHLANAAIFWRILAYIAAFHFVRQQYGFMRLYARREKQSRIVRLIDTFAIYNATLYPLLYWHIHFTSQLGWFVPGDFIALPAFITSELLFAIFTLILSIYIIKELWISMRARQFNIPKNLIVAGTYASWYVGIVTFQGDLIFTLLNVVAHGIPYMALIWIHGTQKASIPFSFTAKGIAIFIGVLLVLAYLEEGFWDIFVWKDHAAIFPLLTQQAPLQHPVLLSALVAMLVLPQITHYIIDGVIWRFSKDSTQARF